MERVGEKIPRQLAARIIHRLRVLYRHLQHLPADFVLSREIQLDEGIFIGFGGFCEVHRGNLNQAAVAVKSLRIHPDQLAQTKRVTTGSLGNRNTSNSPHHCF